MYHQKLFSSKITGLPNYVQDQCT